MQNKTYKNYKSFIKDNTKIAARLEKKRKTLSDKQLAEYLFKYMQRNKLYIVNWF